MELNSGIGGRVKSRQASAGPASPPSSPEKSTSGAQNSTTARNGAGSNLSDKRRMAALISWEKRRKAAEKASKGSGGAAAAKGRSGPAVASKGRGRKAAPAPPAKRRKADNKPLSRSDAARAGWERRKRELAAQEQAREVRRQAAKEGWAKRKGQRKPKQSKTAKDVRREAAKRGWARRKSELAAKPPGRSGAKPLSRSEAARVGWERRKAQLAAAGLDSSSSEEEASESEEESEEEEDRAPTKKTAGAKRVYTANMRAEAARRGWERKKREAAAREAARRGSGYASSASSGRSRKSASTSRSTATASSEPKKEANVKYHGQKYYREGAKRSSRLAEETSTDVYEEMKKVNELVTRLRERGWMEFHPSSRLGSGTATYGYIPSTIASFIRSGYVSQGAVLENGELGIHYALDYEGYGGLKEMIDTFGEDFSPCLTDGMMDEKRVAEWELGEDLPWREVEEEENRKMRELVEEKAVLEDTSVDSDESETVEDDILFVAGILASLDQDAVREEAAALKKGKVGAEPESATSTSNTSSPSMSALKDYESSEDGSDGCKSSRENKHLSYLADASLTREEECKTQSKFVEEEDDVLIIQSRPSLTSSWNFGIC